MLYNKKNGKVSSNEEVVQPEVKPNDVFKDESVTREAVSNKSNNSFLGAGGVNNFLNGRRSNFLNNSNKNEAISNLTNAMIKSFPEDPQDRYKLHIFSRDRFTGLGYSAVVVSGKDMKQNTVCYFTFILEETGRPCQTIKDINMEISAAKMKRGAVPAIYTTGDAINSILINIIEDTISSEYNGATLYGIDGMVVDAIGDQENARLLGEKLALISSNACSLFLDDFLGRVTNKANLAAISNNRDIRLKYEHDFVKRDIIGLNDTVNRADFTISLIASANEIQNGGPHGQGDQQSLASACGYVDAMPTLKQNGALALAPVLNITSMDAAGHNLPGMMLSIMTALVMSRTDLMLTALLPDDAAPLNQNGGLNLLTALGNGMEPGSPVIIDLLDKTLNGNDVNELIKRIFSLPFMFATDIECFGALSHAQSAFTVASAPGNSGMANGKVQAAKDIIKVCNELTNGSFPLNFDTDRIFAGTGVVIPLG